VGSYRMESAIVWSPAITSGLRVLLASACLACLPSVASAQSSCETPIKSQQAGKDVGVEWGKAYTYAIIRQISGTIAKAPFGPILSP